MNQHMSRDNVGEKSSFAQLCSILDLYRQIPQRRHLNAALFSRYGRWPHAGVCNREAAVTFLHAA